MKQYYFLTMMLAAAILVSMTWRAGAEEEWADQKYQMTLTAGGSSVTGDAADFRAHRWMSDGTMFGIRDFVFRDENGKGLLVDFSGHAMTENDLGFLLNLEDEDVGFLDMEYESFRKYYDNTGAVYYPFTTFSSVDTKDLSLDIGEFKLELGTPADDAKGLGAYYEHHYKDGSKSRLTWASVKEGSTTRKISPSWQDVDEKVDVFGLKERTDLKGFNVKGEQRLELVKIDTLRQEQQYSTTATASDKKIRTQHQEIDTTVFSTKFHGDKWFNGEKSYFSAGYLYQMVNGEELETMAEYTATGIPTGAYSHPENRPGSTAKTDLDSHTLVSSYATSPTENLNVMIKIKGEVLDKDGHSLYTDDTDDPPDGISNTNESNEMKDKVRRLGESVSLRYFGLPKTSAYVEYDAEQTYNKLWESLTGVAGSDAADSSGNFERDTRTKVRKDTITIGARTVPVRWFNATTQLRQRWETNDYDDKYETSASSSARSAFIEEMKLNGPEFETKLTFKPLSWLQTAVRYQLAQQKYSTRTDAYAESVNAHVNSDTFTYDVFLQPSDPVLLNLSYSTQALQTKTGASSAASATIPSFNSDVDSWVASASWAATQRLNYIATFNYVETDNFNDFAATGIPLGADFNMYDVGLGFDWVPQRNKDLTIKPRLSYYEYNTNENADEGSYVAQAAWVDVTYKW